VDCRLDARAAGRVVSSGSRRLAPHVSTCSRDVVAGASARNRIRPAGTRRVAAARTGTDPGPGRAPVARAHPALFGIAAGRAGRPLDGRDRCEPRGFSPATKPGPGDRGRREPHACGRLLHRPCCALRQADRVLFDAAPAGATDRQQGRGCPPLCVQPGVCRPADALDARTIGLCTERSRWSVPQTALPEAPLLGSRWNLQRCTPLHRYARLAQSAVQRTGPLADEHGAGSVLFDDCRRHCRSLFTTVSISASVVVRPRLKRTAPMPTRSDTFIADKTGESSTRPE
jgi:hypothetical protein